eukprot:1330656-Amphidinium_carterae.1
MLSNSSRPLRSQSLNNLFLNGLHLPQRTMIPSPGMTQQMTLIIWECFKDVMYLGAMSGRVQLP